MATATNLGTGGSALDAQYGSSGSSNTNEPLLLAHTGENYLYVPGANDNHGSTPSTAALTITGDIECVARVALDDWSPTTTAGILSKESGGTNRSWVFRVNTNGAMQITWFTAGTTASSAAAISNANLSSTADGTALWLRWRLDVDNGASGRDATFWWAADQATEPTSWTQLGTTVTTTGTTSIFGGTADVQIGGSTNAGLPTSGKLYRVILRNGIAGTTVLDADFTTGITSGSQTSFTESSSNAATVTINRSSSGRKSAAVVRPVWLLGTDDFFEVADNSLLDFANADDWTAVVVGNAWGTTTDDTLIAKKAGTTSASTGWVLDMGTANVTQVRIADGTTQNTATAGTRTSGARAQWALVKSGSTLTGYLGSTAGTPVTVTAAGTFANAEVMRIGRLSGAGTNYADVQIIAVMVFRRALSASELAAIAAYYGVS